MEDAEEYDETGMLFAFDGACWVDWFGQAINNDEEYYGCLDCYDEESLQ